MSTRSIGRIARIAATCASGLRAAAEDDEPAGVRRGEPADGQRGDRRRAQVGQADPVDQRGGRERGAVEHHAHALDARVAADGDELDGGVPAGRRGHHQQLAAALEGDRPARRVGLGIQPCAQRRLERVGRGRDVQAPGDLRL